jgi:hypothetical protein
MGHTKEILLKKLTFLQLNSLSVSVGKLSFQSKLPFPISLTIDVDDVVDVDNVDDVDDGDDAILILIKIKLGGLNQDSQSN